MAGRIEELGTLPPTVTVRTGDGQHLWFRRPSGRLVTSLGLGIDLIGAKTSAYVVYPGSRHSNGARYQFFKGFSFDDLEPAALPSTWMAALTDSRPKATTPQKMPTDAAKLLREAIAAVEAGSHRNDVGFDLACRFRDLGLSIDDTEPLMKRYRQRVTTTADPYTVGEVADSLASAFKDVDDVEVEPVSITDFFGEPDLPVVSLLGNGVLCPGTIALLAGEDSVGKTSLAVQMALNLTTASPFLGMDVPEVSPVLFLEAEGGRSNFRSRVKSAAEALGIDHDGLPLFFGPPGSVPLIETPEFKRLIKKSGAKVVMCDTHGYFHDADENSATQWKQLVTRPLRKICNDLGVTIVLFNHLVKSHEVHGKQRIRGTGAMTGDADTVLTLDRTKKIGQRLLTFEKLRHGPPTEQLVLNFDTETGTFEVLAEDPAVATNPRIEEVGEMVEAEIKTATLVAKIKAQYNIGKAAVEKLLKDAVDAGVIVRVRKGWYAPVEN